MILFKIAWRNLWRNPLRSSIVMIFVSGFYNGMMGSYVKNAIQKQHGHIQIHHPEFREYMETKNRITTPVKLDQFLTENNIPYSNRTVMMGLVSVAGKSQAVKIIGIDTLQERHISNPANYIVEGEFLTGTKRNPLYLSTTLAEKLGVKLKSKVILTFSDEKGNAIKSSFKVMGIYDMKNKMMDMVQLYVLKEDLNENLIRKNYSNEYVILLNDHTQTDTTKALIQDEFSNQEVATWKEIAPELELTTQQVQTNQIVIRAIIIIALIFGIINTLLMAVLERTHEIGMMMAIGLNKFKTLSLILLESISLSLFAGPIGLLLAWMITSYYGTNGIDLTSIADSLEQYGMDSNIKLSVEPSTYLNVFILVAITNIIGAIYPAIKAIRLKPAQAIRK